MQFIIENIKWNNMVATPTDIGTIYSCITNHLNACKVKYKSTYNSAQIIFQPVDSKKKRFFISAITNKVLLDKEDPQVKKLGRNYLATERITAKQFDLVKDAVSGTLDRLKVNADIKFYEFEDDPNSFSYWRDGMTNKEWPLPKSFPIAGEGGV